MVDRVFLRMDISELTVPNFIDGIEIWNVSDHTRFLRWTDLTLSEKNLFGMIYRMVTCTSDLVVCDSDLRTFQTSLSGTPVAYLHAQPHSPRNPAPFEIVVGKCNVEDNTQIEVDVSISVHNNLCRELDGVIGFLQGDIRRNNHVFPGRLRNLSFSDYEMFLEMIDKISHERSSAYPGTKEFLRSGVDYVTLVERYVSVGLEDIGCAIFRAKKLPTTLGPTLVAVHPYYMQYHNTNGNRQNLSNSAVNDLMRRYDILFRNHQGPLVLVEEKNRIESTVMKMNEIDRAHETYFVPTADRDSSLFPFTQDREFMWFLGALGEVHGVKFVGGHDCGDTPYRAMDHSTMREITFSGCLRGLANRLEKLGFPKVETMVRYVYS